LELTPPASCCVDQLGDQHYHDHGSLSSLPKTRPSIPAKSRRNEDYRPSSIILLFFLLTPQLTAGNYWAVQSAISLGLKDPEANVFLASLLDSLEKAKAGMSNQEAITDDVVGKAYMENFATNIFAKADDEERAKKATRTTATKFLAASQFMEVLRCFGDLDKEVFLASLWCGLTW
jgi:hypothetical protein